MRCSRWSCATAARARRRRARGPPVFTSPPTEPITPVMKTVTGSSVLPCTPEMFWKVFLDEKFTRTLFLEVLGYRELTVLELTDSSRKLHVVPKINLPGPLQKLVGDSFAYEEHGTLDRAKNEWTWRMVPKKELVLT